MSEARAAAGADRLPWLADEPKRKSAARKRGSGDVLAWAAATILAVGGAAFWIGSSSVTPESSSLRQSTPRSTTVPLPQPRPASTQQVTMAPQPQVSPAPVPEVRQSPAPVVHLTAPSAPKAATSEDESTAASETDSTAEKPKSDSEAAADAPAAAAPRAEPLKPWQPRVVAGAAGRLVEIGAFGSVPQAKDGWRYMVRSYPAVAHLPAVVRPDRNSKGRVFYRFRIGTTSQAHSEVLCQRMQRIRFSCAVVGLSWKSKVER
jgi:hypothetical protein